MNNNPIFVLSSRILQWMPTEKATICGGKIDEDIKVKNIQYANSTFSF